MGGSWLQMGEGCVALSATSQHQRDQFYVPGSLAFERIPCFQGSSSGLVPVPMSLGKVGVPLGTNSVFISVVIGEGGGLPPPF